MVIRVDSSHVMYDKAVKENSCLGGGAARTCVALCTLPVSEWVSGWVSE